MTIRCHPTRVRHRAALKRCSTHRRCEPQLTSRLRSVEAVTASAGPGGIRVVDGEALLLDGVHEVDGGAHQVWSAHPIGDDVDATELPHDVAFEVALVEEELIAQARAAARLDRHPKRQIFAPLALEQR